MNFRNSILMLSVLLVMGCMPKGALPPTEVYPVQWFSGFDMAKRLVKEMPVDDQNDVRALLDKYWYAPFKLINSETQQVFSADHCNQILPVLPQLRTWRPFESRPYLYLTVMCLAAESIANARPARYSALSTFKLDVDFPRYAPKDLTLMISRSETERVLQDNAIVSWAQAETVKFVAKVDKYQARYEMDGAFQTVSLIARGDFNDDGIEDLLLYAQAHVVGGTYTAYRLFWVTKIDVDSPMTLIKKYSKAY